MQHNANDYPRCRRSRRSWEPPTTVEARSRDDGRHARFSTFNIEPRRWSRCSATRRWSATSRVLRAAAGPLDEADAMDTLPVQRGPHRLLVSAVRRPSIRACSSAAQRHVRRRKFIDIWQARRIAEVRSNAMSDLQGCSKCATAAAARAALVSPTWKATMRGPSTQDCEKSYAPPACRRGTCCRKKAAAAAGKGVDRGLPRPLRNPDRTPIPRLDGAE